MSAARYDLTIEQGATFNQTFTSTGVPAEQSVPGRSKSSVTEGIR